MGVFKWLRRERVTVTTRQDIDPAPTSMLEMQISHSTTKVGTIRTEEYKRDLAEFQARRSTGNKELDVTPVKKKCGRHSLPISCTDCAASHDNTFNYEKKSAVKYKKKHHKRVRSATSDDRVDGLPNIQFLFQNQVFMPGNIFESGSYSEPQKSKRRHKVFRSPESDFLQKHIDFKEEDEEGEPPEFFRNNSLPYDVKTFLSPKTDDDVDGLRAAGDLKVSSHSSSEGKDEGCEDKLWEVMSELKNFDQWADEQLQTRTPNKTVSDDSKSDTSAYELPIASSSNLDVATDKDKVWSLGKWGVVPVQIKRLPGVTIDHVRKKRNVEINILRKCRHPNIILLMGLYPDIRDNVQLICERCVDSLYGLLHIQGRVLSAQTSVQYALDIANALVFLRMQGYVHTGLNSVSIMLSYHGAAKLADLGPCAKLAKPKERPEKSLDLYSPEPQYVNIEDTRETNAADCEPLLSNRSSETYLQTNAVSKPYTAYQTAEHYRWQAPELFVPDEDGSVHPCAKSDVYSLCLILWECCNASIPWNSLSYEKLKELYTLWKTGIRLPQDGTYPGSLLALLQRGLTLMRDDRMDLASLQDTLQIVKDNLEDIEYIIIPARLSKKKSAFSSVGWDTTSPADSDVLSPRDVIHHAVVHREGDSNTSTDNVSPSDASPVYHSIRKSKTEVYAIPEKCFISDEEQERPILKYEHLPENDFSSACSTPIAKIRARITNIGTPGALHRSDSTEYCSILSPNRTNHFLVDDSLKKHINERSTVKLSRSFTPQSYKPLHIKVPEFNLDCVKTLMKDQNESDRSSYNFDINNYSLPTTPIARSNKLRKNAWLSGELSATERSTDKLKDCGKSNNEEFNNNRSSPDASFSSNKNCSIDGRNLSQNSEALQHQDECNSKYYSPECKGAPQSHKSCSTENLNAIFDSVKTYAESMDKANQKPCSPESVDRQDSFADFKRPSRGERAAPTGLSVRPLVAIHEKWIYEANRKTGRSMALPDDQKSHLSAVKPASHRVDTLQQSLPQLPAKRSPKPFRAKNGGQWDQFCQNREAIARSMNFAAREPERPRMKNLDKCTSAEEVTKTKIDQATDTRSIEEFIKELIRKEFQHLMHETSDHTYKSEEINNGISNIVDSLNGDEETVKKESVKSFSRVKINGNNKPLLQITFSRSGENNLQVLDTRVNVTLSEGSPGADDGPALKRCQAFNAIQEARSTEDLYIDDDLSTQLQENFGGKVKLIPLHGSLHEILCEREDDCCLVKVKQENGCDTIYFRCDNSDAEPRGADAVDAGAVLLSLCAARRPRAGNTRPKSEIFASFNKINKETRALSSSSPSLVNHDKNDEVEVNIENAVCYQDSSSEECIKCQVENDDFELLEKKIEEDLANSTLSSMTCGCLEKISEENLSVINEDAPEKNDR
ncbi:uncharacterized protein LOC128676124 isoform X2 [Plodia interpunctella]|uniref:uncharacterized protein LOC128676124 isoform X2 n=1 Tax=Plodia interpunctella TaxID=58824 RepID=UPI0023681D5E|nr:uncharacterized protein LOC128676124 isoform X2 [Plodia interpunctella]